MKSNETLQNDVQCAIKWEPLLHAAEIGVTVVDGIVTLTGTVDSYAKKHEAEVAAKNVVGVQAVVEKIEITNNLWHKKNDTDIAKEVLEALKQDWQVPEELIKVKVEDAWITLDGEMPWNYQREAAKKAISKLLGIKGISNNIIIKTESRDEIEKAKIEKALSLSWSINDSDITVLVDGHNVTLNGTVDSIYQKDEAARLSWNAPGVWHVENNLVVEYDYSYVD